MKVKNVILLLLISLMLQSCLNKEENIKKIDTFSENKIVTKKLKDFWSNDFLNKSGVQKSRESIIISSNVYWTVWNINLEEWDIIKEWKILVKLKDNIKDYWINIEKSNNAIEKLNLKYKSTKLIYEKQRNTILNNISNLEINLINLSKNKWKTLEDIGLNLSENDLKNNNSKSNLELDKINNSLAEANLKFENKKALNKEELISIKNSVYSYYDVFSIWSYDLIQFSDEILWVSKLNKHKNDKFDNYLWTKSSLFKTKVKNQLKKLIKLQKEEISKVKIDLIKETNIKDYLKKLENYYNLEKNFLNNLQMLLKEQSIVGIDFTQETIDSYVEEINSFQAKLQRWNKDILEFKNKSYKFLDTYKKWEESIKKQIKNITKEKQIIINSLWTNNKKWEISKDKIEINFENNEKKLKTQINILKKDLEISKKDEEISLKTITNSIKDAEISKKQAISEYRKLTIISPINWTIQKKFINKWQQVNPWTKLFWVINDNKPQIKVFFSKNELIFIKKDMPVIIINDWIESKGKITSFSNIANDNLKYTWIIEILDKNNSFWEILKIKIPIKSNKKLLDLKLIRLSNKEWIWKIKILSEKWEIKLEEVRLWKIFHNKIEILWCENKKLDCDELNIIIE